MMRHRLLPLFGVSVSAWQIAWYDGVNFTQVSETNVTYPVRTGEDCRVLHVPVEKGSLVLPPGLEEKFHLIITDDAEKVEWLQYNGKYYFLEDRHFPRMHDARILSSHKESLPINVRREGMSVLLPEVITDEQVAESVAIGTQIMRHGLFVDDGTPESRYRALEEYTSVVLMNQDAGTPPQTLIDAVAHGTIPILIGHGLRLNYSMYFPYSVIKMQAFMLESIIEWMLSTPADSFYVYNNAGKMVQEWFLTRYRHPFSQRLQVHAREACRSIAEPRSQLIFLSVYSALGNFDRRMAIRDTWLPLLLAIGEDSISYKFFMADPFTEKNGNEHLIDAVRSEHDLYQDMVFLADSTDEYPIGRKGLACMLWVARHSSATYWFKIDDDIYLRPPAILQRFKNLQRAELYWGAFDYGGMVSRDPASPHYTPESVWPEPIFPPYARGASVAMSMDLLRLIAEQERIKPFAKIIVEDVSYGYYVWQLVHERGLTSATFFDDDEKHFALDPKCCTEKSHPNNCWNPLKDNTFVVHHVNATAVRCMYERDIDFARSRSGDPGGTDGIGKINSTCATCFDLDSDPLDRFKEESPNFFGRPIDRHQVQVLGEMYTAAGTRKGWSGTGIPDPPDYRATYAAAAAIIENPSIVANGACLCHCVDTPPAHPGRPLQTSGMIEGPHGPRLSFD
jgi:hypothetical protein